jgi:hypothetical protein
MVHGPVVAPRRQRGSRIGATSDPTPHRLWVALAGIVGTALLLHSSPGTIPPAAADQLVEDFEGENESSRYPVRFLRNWAIIDSVDLKTERRDPNLCRDTGTCIDLIGTANLTTGSILSKVSYPQGTYLIGFMLYRSGRDADGNAIATGGASGRLPVSFSSRSIYANNNITSQFAELILMRVRGGGKLRFLAGGEAPNIGPLLDNVMVIDLGDVTGP